MANDIQEEVTLVTESQTGDVAADGYSYRVVIYTGDALGSGTDANVLLTIYGEDGDSGQRVLEKGGDNFERDTKTSIRIITSSYLGKIKKIVIGHDNSGLLPAWFLDKVTVEDVKSREVFEFPCNRWLSKDEDDGLISRELTWSNVEVKEKEDREAYPYTVNIYTGTVSGAGTDANVYITVYGTESRSRKYKLLNKGTSTFESGMKDTYNIQTTAPLGTIYKVRVGHDNSGFGPGWFLDKIEVEDDVTGEIVKFVCGKWLATDSEDGLIRRDLLREGFSEEEVDSTVHEIVTYTVNIVTGTAWGAGTDANILFTLYGIEGESEQQKVENQGSTTFENGMTDTVKFDSPYLGTLTKIRIGHDNTGYGAAWYLDKVTVEDPKDGKTVVFLCDRWLATNADDGQIERELVREDGLTVIIQNEKEKKEREEKERKEQEEKEKNGETEESVVVIEYQKITVVKKEEEDSKERDEKEAEKEKKEEEEEKRRRERRERMRRSREEKELREREEKERKEREEKERKEREEKERKEREEKEKKEREEKERKEREEKEKKEREEKERKEREEKERKEREEKERKEGEEKERREREEKERKEREEKESLVLIKEQRIVITKTREELINTEIKGGQEKREKPAVTYTVNIVTGASWGAGTDANILFTLYGTEGESEQQKVENKGSTTFENGMTDTVKFDSPYLGTLTMIRIGHDNTGYGPAWYLDKVTVEDPKNEKIVVFPCSRWLVANSGDGMIERELVREDGLTVVIPNEKEKKEREEKERQQREKERKEREEKERKEREEKRRKEREERERKEREERERKEREERERKEREERERKEREERERKEREERERKEREERERKEREEKRRKEREERERKEREERERKEREEKKKKEREEMKLKEKEDKEVLVLIKEERIIIVENEEESNKDKKGSEEEEEKIQEEKQIKEQEREKPEIHHIQSSDMEKLLAIESEPQDDWSKVKTTKDAEVWRRSSTNANEPPITKSYLDLEGIPYEVAVKYITDWEQRQKWDRTFIAIDILKRRGNMNVIYNSFNIHFLCDKRELVQECLDRRDIDKPRYMQARCSIFHPTVPSWIPNDTIRAENLISGIIIRPVDDGTQSSKATAITQVDLRGSATQGIKNSYLANHPIKWMRKLKKFYAKHKDEADLNANEDGD